MARFAPGLPGGVRKGMVLSGEELKIQSACPGAGLRPRAPGATVRLPCAMVSGPLGALSFQPPQWSRGHQLASQEDKMRRANRQGHLVGPCQSQGGK